MRQILKKIIRVLDGTAAEYKKPEGGQSVVELAFMLPVLIIMITGLVEVGWFTNNYLILLEVTRVGARYGTTLGGDRDPIAWESNDETVLASLPPGDSTNLITTSLSADNTINYRLCTNAALEQYPGFYHEILCLMIRSMDPIRINLEDPEMLDDIVISVFSANLIPADRDALPAAYKTSATEAWAPVLSSVERNNMLDIIRPFEDPGQSTNFLNSAPLLPNVDPANPNASNTQFRKSAQIIVTGRYPANVNECADYRDPFNFAGMTGTDLDPVELDETRDKIIRDRGGNGNVLLDTGAENRRGFAYTGKWAQRDGSNCLGSSWSLREMEAMLNLRGRDATANVMAQLPPSQALVLVEIFWHHDLLINMPAFSPMFEILGGENGSYIEVWASFPIPSAEFVLDLSAN